MVRGLDIFKKYFEKYADNYLIIGGTACDIHLDAAGFTARATKDIDIVLVIEALSSDFVKQFWRFIQDGKYEQKEKSTGGRNYYRFIKPAHTEFPFQLELFSRNPDLPDLDTDTHLTPVPVEENLSSLSAILLNEDYYHFLMRHSVVEDGLHRANTAALICLKAKAYLEIVDRIAKGSEEDSKHLRKHKGDIFRLALLLRETDSFELPKEIQKDMIVFLKAIEEDLPGKEIFKEMGAGNISVVTIFNQISKSFNAESNN